MKFQTLTELRKEIEDKERIVRSHYHHCSSMKYMDTEQIKDIQQLNSLKALLTQTEALLEMIEKGFEEFKQTQTGEISKTNVFLFYKQLKKEIIGE